MPNSTHGQALISVSAAESTSEEFRWVIAENAPAIVDSVVRDTEAIVPTFGDDAWSLSALGGAAGRAEARLHFVPGARADILTPPEAWRDCMRRVAYVLINEGMPVTWTRAFRTSRVARLEAGTIKGVWGDLVRFVSWLDERGVTCLADVHPDLLDTYFAHVAGLDVQPKVRYARLKSVERLPHLAPMLPPQDRMCAPQWDAGWLRKKREAAADGSARPVLDPSIADPMLLAAITTVRQLGPDILAAYDEVTAVLADNVSASHVAAKAVLQAYDAEGGVPGAYFGARLRLDALGLRYAHGLKETTFSTALAQLGLRHRVIDSPLCSRTPVHGRVGDALWCGGIPVNELSGGNGTPPALRHLRAACWVVLAFLSGARPEELRHLPTDALETMPPRQPDGPVRYLLNAAKRKRERDADGRASEQGAPAQWVTLAAGADAVRIAQQVAERTNPGGTWLFPAPPSVSSPDAAIKHASLACQVSDWITWYNDLARTHGWGEAHVIPSDRGKAFDLATFRRTAAWFIFDQPRGRAALQQQYQHASTVQGAGYADTQSVGLRKVMTQARRSAHDRLMAEVGESILTGTHLSGPAADRLVEAAKLSEPLRATFQNDREAEALRDLDRPVYDNPGSYSLCVFDVPRAACLSGTPAEDDDGLAMPDRGACQLSCACHARTDAQASLLRADIQRHRREAASALTPQPLSVRLEQVAERKQRLLDQHDRDGVFVDLAAVQAGLRQSTGADASSSRRGAPCGD